VTGFFQFLVNINGFMVDLVMAVSVMVVMTDAEAAM